MKNEYFYNYLVASIEHNEKRHFQNAIVDILEKENVKMIKSRPESLFDGWVFETDKPIKTEYPFIKKITNMG